MNANLTLVLGGVASGKSAFAEGLFADIANRTYIATAQAIDAEMRAKIATHVTQRGPDWRTVEAPLDLAATLAAQPAESPVLLDCATLWLTNHLIAGHDLALESKNLVAALTTCAAPVVVVSNEVGLAGVAENAMARQFQCAQGVLNQLIAAKADVVINVIAGLPQVLKGAL